MYQLTIKCVKSCEVSTSHYPNTVKTLSELMPHVLDTDCGNYKDLPFAEEVKKTELAHLFEHILIQKMTDLKDAKGENAIYSGLTSWDWEVNPQGTFDVWISATEKDKDILDQALLEAVNVFNAVLVH